MTEYRGYTGKVEFDADARLLHGEVVGIRDVVTFQGRSVAELEKPFRESVDDYLEFCRKRGVGAVEGLENRTLLAGNVLAAVEGGVLSITGDDAGNQVVVTQRHERVANQAAVRSGVTSVDLDTALLEAAANLKLTGASGTVRPAAGNFDVGFPILPSTSFIFQKDPFAPVGGTIEHGGTVTFDAKGTAVTVGKFQIGFDAARATGGRSGFFIRDTAGGLGILFDIAAPDEVNVGRSSLAIKGADLLVSPEFAAALQSLGLASANLTGADVGDAQVNAHTTAVVRESLIVSGTDRTRVNGQGSASFAADLDAIEVSLGKGDDRLTLRGLDLDGDVSADAGAGDDAVFVSFSRIGGDLFVELGDGPDYLNPLASRVSGLADFDGQAGRDSLVTLFSRFGAIEADNFEFRFPRGGWSWGGDDDGDDDEDDDD